MTEIVLHITMVANAEEPGIPGSTRRRHLIAKMNGSFGTAGINAGRASTRLCHLLFRLWCDTLTVGLINQLGGGITSFGQATLSLVDDTTLKTE